MLKKENRLGKTKDVKLAVSRGRGFFNPLFTLKFLLSHKDKRRFTVVVSTKVSKKAVVRNKIKRILREAIRNHLAQFPAGDYAVLVKPAAAAATPRELRDRFESILEQALKKVR